MLTTPLLGLRRVQETYISQLRELQKSKPRGQLEENLLAEMSRIESSLTVARDDLVSSFQRMNMFFLITRFRAPPNFASPASKTNSNTLIESSRNWRPISRRYKVKFRFFLIPHLTMHRRLKQLFKVFMKRWKNCKKLWTLRKTKFSRAFAARSKSRIFGNTRNDNWKRCKKGAKHGHALTLKSLDWHISSLLPCWLCNTIRLAYLVVSSRYQFKEEQLATTRDRLAHLEKTIASEEKVLAGLQTSQESIVREIQSIEETIANLGEELKKINEELEEKTKELEEVKRTSSKASKGLDKALKEIGMMVSLPDILLCPTNLFYAEWRTRATCFRPILYLPQMQVGRNCSTTCGRK